MIRKLAPANWTVRTWLIVTIGLGLIGMTGCAPDKPARLSDECAEAVMHRMLDSQHSETADDIARYFDEECEVSK